ncbi:hypothetical protein PRLR6025_19780 [Prevotella lacticifex]|nr:hypothetical protein PRLR6025_19780 [Prevotella lacticifex]
MPEQPSNALYATLAPFGIVSSPLSDVQSEKAASPIVCMPGMLTVVRDVQPLKQYLGNDVTVEGILTVAIEVPPIAAILVMV